MPRTYTRKDGTTVKYAQSPNRDHGNGSGSDTNLTLALSDPSLKIELAEVAQALGLVKDRGQGAGSGSITQLIAALGQAARRDGSAAVAKRLRRIITP